MKLKRFIGYVVMSTMIATVGFGNFAIPTASASTETLENLALNMPVTTIDKSSNGAKLTDGRTDEDGWSISKSGTQATVIVNLRGECEISSIVVHNGTTGGTGFLGEFEVQNPSVTAWESFVASVNGAEQSTVTITLEQPKVVNGVRFRVKNATNQEDFTLREIEIYGKRLTDNAAFGKLPVTSGTEPGDSYPVSLTDGERYESTGENKWFPSAFDATATIDFEKKYELSSIVLYNGYHFKNAGDQDVLTNFRFEYYHEDSELTGGGEWRVIPETITQIVETDDLSDRRSVIKIISPIITSKIKLVPNNGTPQPNRFRVREIEIYGVEYTNPLGLTNVARGKSVTSLVDKSDSVPSSMTNGEATKSFGEDKWFVKSEYGNTNNASATIDLVDSFRVYSIIMHHGYYQPDTNEEYLKHFSFKYLDASTGEWRHIPESMMYDVETSLTGIKLKTPIVTNQIQVISGLSTKEQTGQFRVREIEVYGIAAQPEPRISQGLTITAVPGELPDNSDPNSLIDGVTIQSGGINKWYPRDLDAQGAYAEINLNGIYDISSIMLYNGYAPIDLINRVLNGLWAYDFLKDFKFQYYSSGQWIDVPGSEITGCEDSTVRISLDAPIRTSKIKLVSNQGADFRIREIELFGTSVQQLIANAIYNVDEDDVTVSCDVFATNGSKMTILMALYDNDDSGRLVDIALESMTIEVASTRVEKTLNATDIDDYDIKVLAWENDQATGSTIMSPLSEVIYPSLVSVEPQL